MTNGHDNDGSRVTSRGDFISLLMSHMDSIYTYIVIMVPYAAEADDIFQDTATTIWEKFSDYRAGSDFKNWALTIARYKVLQYYDAQRRRKVLFSTQTIETLAERLASDHSDDSHEIEVLKKCVDKLGQKGRELIVLKYTRKITTRALADKLGRSVAGLYDSLSRIHASLVDCVRRSLAAEERF